MTTDTSREAERLQVEIWRSMTPLQKVRLVGDATRAVRNLSLAGIRARHPEATQRECVLRLAIIILGRRLAIEAYPEIRSLLE